MQYNVLCGDKVSALGMGNMRLPTIGGDRGAPVDYDKASAMIDYAVKSGINYFDTAYVYHDGESEKFLGEALNRYPRDEHYIATKYFVLANPDYKAVFEEQLSRLNTDYIDFYLLHGLFDHTADMYLTNGCIDYFLEQKKLGRIRHLGFSFHCSCETLQKVVDFRQWDFAQLQLNYLDWEYAASRREYEILAEKNIPMVVMEPVRGGALANLNENAMRLVKQCHEDWTPAEWALRWVRTNSEVKVILSGMSAMEQLVENVKTFSDERVLNEEEVALLSQVSHEIKKGLSLPCTACRYCCSDCPMGIDIPALLEIYNEFEFNRFSSNAAKEKLNDIPSGKKPSDCIGCGSCQSHCPQSIDIPEAMKKLAGLE